MASPIEDPSSLPGKTVSDQVGEKIGKVKDVYASEGQEQPMWVTIEASTGLFASRILFAPIARLKEEDDQIRMPYSSQHLNECPEVEPGDELSEEDDRLLRDFYAIDHADQEIRSGENEESYAAQVPDTEGPLRKTG